MPVPRFADVPDNWKHPFGPYRQAPPDKGGEWWLVNPFTAPHGVMPWEQQKDGTASDPPADFVQVFGPRPGLSHPFLREWEQNLEAWSGIEWPDWLSSEQISIAMQIFEAWGMGKPVSYRGPYGYSVRFPHTKQYEFEAAASTAFIHATHWVVASFQDFLRNKGLAVDKPHPYLPPAPQ